MNSYLYRYTMKIIILLVTTLLLATGITSGQTVISSKGLPDTHLYDADKQQLKRMDDEHFLILTRPEEQKEVLTKYNARLEEQFSINIKRTRFYTYFEFIEESNAIIIVRIEETGKKKHKISASLYNAADGSLTRSNEFLLEDEKPSVIKFSENNHYFISYNVPGNTNKHPVTANIYSSVDAEHIGKLRSQLQRKEEFECMVVTNSGDLIMGSTESYTNLKFAIYGKNGVLKKSLSEKSHLSGKQYYKNYLFQEVAPGVGKMMFTRGVNDLVEGIDLWNIDYHELKVRNQYAHELEKEHIKEKLYGTVYSTYDTRTLGDLIQGSARTGFKSLKDFTLTNYLGHQNGSVTVVLEQLTYSDVGKGRRHYFGKEVLLINLDEVGNYRWSALIDKKTANFKGRYHLDSNFKPWWSGLKTVVSDHGGEIKLINWENIADRELYVSYRKIDSETGEFLLARPLIKDDHISINTSYVEWLTPSRLVLINMKGVDRSRIEDELKLQVVNVDR